MLAEAQRAGIWLYRQANRFGLLTSPTGQRLFNVAYRAYKRHFEDPFQGLVDRHPALFFGGHVIDVGANTGYTASVFASAIDPRFCVWAFEPSSVNFAALEILSKRHGVMRRITPIQAAVGDRTGVVDLVLSDSNPGDHRISRGKEKSSDIRVERVQLTSIDETVRLRRIQPVAFIKVDVQGYELSVCHGMAATLEANPEAAVAVEYSPSSLREFGTSPRELPTFFADRGYGAYRLTRRGTLEPLDLTAPLDNLPPPGYMDVLFARTPQQTEE